MGHLVCRAQVTRVLHDGLKTHVAQQPNRYGPEGIEEINKREKEIDFWCLFKFSFLKMQNVRSPASHHKRENRKVVSSSITLEAPYFPRLTMDSGLSTFFNLIGKFSLDLT